MYKCAIILSAGQGTRIKSNIPKVLHKVCGKEMVNHVIDNIRKADITDVNLVIGKGAELVKEKTKSKFASYSIQHEQLGTGHAVRCATEFLENKDGCVLIFAGDAPLIDPSTIKALVKQHEDNKNSATLITSLVENPNGYGRVIRDKDEFVLKIVEDKDCNDNELLIREVNSAMYCFDIKDLLSSLKDLSNNNTQGEYYLTDVIGILQANNKKIGAIITDFKETIGVNSRLQLAEAEEILKDKINKGHLENGVTLIDPKSTYIGINVEIGKDTIIYPGVILEGNTVIGEECLVMQNTRITNSKLSNNVKVESSVILDSEIGSQTTVGPFAYIRPESYIGSKVKIGNFVEVKKSSIGDETKASHLTYIGDTVVGKNCNFGCGSITVNYSGKEKHTTFIGDFSFIGCNANLIAPIKISDNTYIAAGSTITENVLDGDLAIARSKQINIGKWVSRRFENNLKEKLNLIKK